METTVVSYIDATQTRKVIVMGAKQLPPTCCAHSRSDNGFTCLHVVTVIFNKHGAGNDKTYIARRHFSVCSKSTYANGEFRLPSQDQMEEMMQEARKKGRCGDARQVPVQLPPPRVIPPLKAGKSLQSWY